MHDILKKYECTKCEQIPLSEQHILLGCPCGNKFFRQREQTVTKFQKTEINKGDHLGNIKVQETGVFRIDLDSLFGQSKLVAITDDKDIIHLNLD